MMLLIRMLIDARDRRSRLVSRCATGVNCANGSGGRRQSLTGGGAKSQAERTTAMLTIIVAVFLITELPQGILLGVSFNSV